MTITARKLTPQIVREFHDYMARKFRARIITRDSPEVKAVDWALEMMGIKDCAGFLGRFGITVGDLIYLPYTPGEGNIHDLVRQVRTIVHEIIHVEQFRADNRFALRYLLSKERRAHFEERAFRGELELMFYCYGELTDKMVWQRVRTLKYYRVRKSDIKDAYRSLLFYKDAVLRGGVATKPGKAAIRWLNKRLK